MDSFEAEVRALQWQVWGRPVLVRFGVLLVCAGSVAGVAVAVGAGSSEAGASVSLLVYAALVLLLGLAAAVGSLPAAPRPELIRDEIAREWAAEGRRPPHLPPEPTSRDFAGLWDDAHEEYFGVLCEDPSRTPFEERPLLCFGCLLVSDAGIVFLELHSRKWTGQRAPNPGHDRKRRRRAFAELATARTSPSAAVASCQGTSRTWPLDSLSWVLFKRRVLFDSVLTLREVETGETTELRIARADAKRLSGRLKTFERA